MNSLSKRLLDYVIAIAGLLLLWPVLLLLVILVQLETPGPGIFSQKRVGRNGRVFYCYKLRTMYRDAPDVPTHAASASQVTPLGGFLRATKIDEFPQLVNILRGQMSLVGPRPSLCQQTELIDERQKRGVLALLPGITGLAQVQGVDMSDPVRLAEIDAEYLRTRNLRLDLKLIAKTVFARKGRGDRIPDASDRDD